MRLLTSSFTCWHLSSLWPLMSRLFCWCYNYRLAILPNFQNNKSTFLIWKLSEIQKISISAIQCPIEDAFSITFSITSVEFSITFSVTFSVTLFSFTLTFTYTFFCQLIVAFGNNRPFCSAFRSDSFRMRNGLEYLYTDHPTVDSRAKSILNNAYIRVV